MECSGCSQEGDTKLHETELLHLAEKIKENAGICPAQDWLCSQMEDVGREELA